MKKANTASRLPRSSKTNIVARFPVTGIIITLVTALVVFSPAFRNELVNWDDYNYIRDNPVIQDLSASNIAHIFSFNTYIMGNYHPLTIISYMIDYQIGGTEPWIYHFHNLLLHLINILLAAWFTWLLTRKPKVTLLVAILFAIHPMRVESVVWASERKDVLYTLFFLLSAISYLYYRTSTVNRQRYYIGSLLLFILSILSKGQAVVLPLVLILTDFYLDQKFNLRRLPDKIPFLAISLASGIQAILAQSSSLTAERMVHFPFHERIIYALFNITAYLWKFIFPYQPACYYGYPVDGDMLIIYLGAAAAIVILTFTFILLRKNRTVVFGSLFFLATIIIVIQLLPIGNAIIADRYTYIPYFGLFFLTAMLLEPLLEKPRWKNTVLTLLLLQEAVFAIASYSQSKMWRNNETLWTQAVKRNPGDGLPYNNLGYHYVESKQYDKAIPILRQAIEKRTAVSEVYHAYQNMGKALLETGRQADAIPFFNLALAEAPQFAEAVFAKGLAFHDLKQYDSAIAQFTKVINNDLASVRHPNAYYSRAMSLNKMGKTDSALADYTRAIELLPSYAEAYTNRGNIYFNQGRLDQAISDYDQSLSYRPGDGNTLLNRSFALFRKGRFREALRDAEAARSAGISVDERYLNDLRRR